MNEKTATDDKLELRLARPGERDAIIVLANTVFKAAPPLDRPMEKALPLFFAEDNITQWAIAAREGQVVSAVGAHRFDVRSGRLTFGAAHIGAVCTAPEWQGRGIASRLLDLECSLLRSQGVALAFVSGGRGLYHRAGATSLAEPAQRYVLPARAADALDLRPLATERVAGAARLWELEPVTIVRSHEMWAKSLDAVPDRPGWERAQVVVDEPARAYVVVDHQASGRVAEVAELAGDRVSAIAAARHLAAVTGCTTVSVAVPGWDVTLGKYLDKEGASAVPPNDLAAEWEGNTYFLVDPVRFFQGLVESLGPLDNDIRQYRLLPTGHEFSLEGRSGVIESGDRAWACRLLFGSGGKALTPLLPVALPWWRGVTYG